MALISSGLTLFSETLYKVAKRPLTTLGFKGLIAKIQKEEIAYLPTVLTTFPGWTWGWVIYLQYA